MSVPQNRKIELLYDPLEFAKVISLKQDFTNYYSENYDDLFKYVKMIVRENMTGYEQMIFSLFYIDKKKRNQICYILDCSRHCIYQTLKYLQLILKIYSKYYLQNQYKYSDFLENLREKDQNIFLNIWHRVPIAVIADKSNLSKMTIYNRIAKIKEQLSFTAPIFCHVFYDILTILPQKNRNYMKYKDFKIL